MEILVKDKGRMIDRRVKRNSKIGEPYKLAIYDLKTKVFVIHQKGVEKSTKKMNLRASLLGSTSSSFGGSNYRLMLKA